eukprot:48588_1
MRFIGCILALIMNVPKCNMLSNTTLYVSSSGCDVGICSVNNNTYSKQCSLGSVVLDWLLFDICCEGKRLRNNTYQNYVPLSTCLSMDYAYKCLLGNDNVGVPHPAICKNANYKGTGIVDMGDGVFNLSFPINTNNTQITIRGTGSSSATLNYVGNVSTESWFGCKGSYCYLKMVGLTLASINSSILSHSQQLSTINGGTLEFDDILFDGNNYARSSALLFWEFRGNSTLIFQNCIFRNNNATYLFDGVTVTFSNCSFQNNTIILNDNRRSNHYENNIPMFLMENSAYLIFEDCLFENNEIKDRTLFTITSGTLIIRNTKFIGNHDTCPSSDCSTSMIFINNINTQSYITLNITSSLFEGNIGHQAFIYARYPESIIRINVDNTTFLNNNMIYDYYIKAHWSNKYNIFLKISNSEFLNNSCDDGLMLLGVTSLSITNTIWSNYLCEVVIYVNGWGYDEYIMIDNIKLKNIIGSAVYIDDTISPITILNSEFYNITSIDQIYKGACIHLGYNDDIAQGYTVKNIIFEQCTSLQRGAALHLRNFGNDSTIQNLSFINNYADKGAADIYIRIWNSRNRVPGIVNTICGIHISGSQSNEMPSSIWLDNRNPYGGDWTLSLQDWAIQYTTNYSAVYLTGPIAFHVENLTANNNEKEVIRAHCDFKTICIGNSSIINSFFIQNQYEIVYISYDKLSDLVHSPILIIRNTIFDENDGILAVTVDGTINAILSGQPLVFGEDNIAIQAIFIENIGHSVNGWWFGCNVTKCKAQRYSTNVFQNYELLIVSSNHPATLPKTDGDSQFFYADKSVVLHHWYFTGDDFPDSHFDFVFDGEMITVTFGWCDFGYLNSNSKFTFQVKNAATLIFRDCWYGYIADLLFNVLSGSLLYVENSVFEEITGDRSQALIQVGSSMAQNSVTVHVIDSIFDTTNDYHSVIYVKNCSWNCSFANIYIDGVHFVDNDNVYDYCGDGYADVFLANSFFQNNKSQLQ